MARRAPEADFHDREEFLPVYGEKVFAIMGAGALAQA
jgi:hypothetical protein